MCDFTSHFPERKLPTMCIPVQIICELCIVPEQHFVSQNIAERNALPLACEVCAWRKCNTACDLLVSICLPIHLELFTEPLYIYKFLSCLQPACCVSVHRKLLVDTEECSSHASVRDSSRFVYCCLPPVLGISSDA